MVYRMQVSLSGTMKRILLALILCNLCTQAFAEDIKWELKKDREGIKVYSGNVPNSNIRAIRAVCTIEAQLSELAALLLDAEARGKWVYGIDKTYLIKRLSDSEQVYYSEMSMPWPLSNRDAVVLLRISQDPVTRVMSANMTIAEGYLPPKKDKVRVPFLKVNWTVTPVRQNLLSIEYQARADPGGLIPSWVVNLFSTKSPFESFKALRSLLQTGNYELNPVDFIEN